MGTACLGTPGRAASCHLVPPLRQPAADTRPEQLLTVCHYVEHNPVRAGLAAGAQDWPWSSAAPPRFGAPSLDAGPVFRPPGWLAHVNTAQTEAEVEALRQCIRRRRPYVETAWMEQVAE